MVVDIKRARITHPTGKLEPVRFVFRDGQAAVWTGSGPRAKPETGERVFFVSDATFVKSSTRREPDTVLLSDGTEWLIKSTPGGCGCAIPMKAHSINQLLDPEFSSL